jgi:hypothetical protein
MYKDIASVFALDKSVAFLFIVPLDLSFGHDKRLSLLYNEACTHTGKS